MCLHLPIKNILETLDLSLRNDENMDRNVKPIKVMHVFQYQHVNHHGKTQVTMYSRHLRAPFTEWIELFISYYQRNNIIMVANLTAVRRVLPLYKGG